MRAEGVTCSDCVIEKSGAELNFRVYGLSVTNFCAKSNSDPDFYSNRTEQNATRKLRAARPRPPPMAQVIELA